MAVPYTFGTATSSIPLSQLDSNFNTVITLGNTAIQLGNTVTTLNNMTLANVTISSGNVTITNVAITTANVTTANITTDNITNGTVITSLTLSYGTPNGVAYLNGSKVLTSGTALTFDGTNFATTGTATAAKLIPTGTSVTGNGMYLPDPNAIGISTNGVRAIYIDSSQNVGIGGLPLYSLANRTTFNVNGTNSALIGISTGGTTVNAAYFYWDGSLAHLNSTTALAFETGATERMRIDSSGNLGLGVTPSAFGSAFRAIELASGSLMADNSATTLYINQNTFFNGSAFVYKNTGTSTRTEQGSGGFRWYNAPSGTAGNAITFTQAMTLDDSGNLLVGATSAYAKFYVSSSGVTARFDGSTNASTPVSQFVTSDTTGNSTWQQFYTDGGTSRGSITYNRAGGLTVYNTMSDYRAKDIYGSITNSGALIDSVPVYMGKMKDATQERPMFIAHETPDYAHTGKKDAIDADGNPVYQQMDASALIPVMWAEIQSLRKRLTALELT
jgi:hypothetical protein